MSRKKWAATFNRENEMTAIEILAQQPDTDLNDFASFLDAADRPEFWEQIREARTE